MTVRLSLKDAGAYFGRLSERQKLAALRGLRSAAARGVQIVQVEIIPAKTPQPVDRGVYRAGWRWFPVPDGAVIENAEPHAAFVEHGVRAANVKVGRAMLAALQEWARRHGFEDPLGAAWAIARAMRRRGIFGAGLGVLRELNERLRGGVVAEEVRREVDAVR